MFDWASVVAMHYITSLIGNGNVITPQYNYRLILTRNHSLSKPFENEVTMFKDFYPVVWDSDP